MEQMQAQAIVGFDVGGSSIKYAPVEILSGRLLTPLASIPTPRPGTPQQLIDCIAEAAGNAAPGAPIGVALPSVMRKGVVYTATHLDATLIGTDFRGLLQARVSRPVACLNDADAAGLAEVRLGAARGVHGTVLVLTFGTGIGSALFIDGRLLPNTELGHLEIGGHKSEQRASARARADESLDWTQWSERVNEYLAVVHRLFWPELVVIGGGVSENYHAFGSLLRARCELRPATLGASAGTVGAALAASASGLGL